MNVNVFMLYFFENNEYGIVVCVSIEIVYDDVVFDRMIVLFFLFILNKCIVVDVFDVFSDKLYIYDLLLYYSGYLIDINFEY